MALNEEGKFDFGDLIILEMANNHQGSVAHGSRIIEAFAPVVSRHGVRAAMKFQLRDLDTFVHPAYRDNTEHKHIQRFLSTRLAEEEFAQLAAVARQAGFTTMATPSDEQSVALAEELGIEVLKIASASATDWPLLERAVRSGLPIICSTGGIPLEEIDNLVSFLTHRGAHFALMHCVSIYPTPRHKLHLQRIRLLRSRYPEIPIGFSTHEDPNDVDAVKVAYAMGARLFERHVGLETPEILLNAYSSRPEQIDRWLEAYHQAVSMAAPDGSMLKLADPEEQEQLRQQMRGAYLRRDVAAGAELQRADVFFAMPCLDGQLRSGRWRPGMVADRAYQANESLPASLRPQAITKKDVVYRAIHDVKGLLNMARVPVNYDSSVSLLHQQGIEHYPAVGAFIVNCFKRQGYAKKLIIMLAGQRQPDHYAKRADRTIQVLYGQVEVVVEGRRRTLQVGDTLILPPGVWSSMLTHRGAILEEVATSESEELVYAEPKINNAPAEELKTVLVNWGRHQFDRSAEAASNSPTRQS